MSKKIEGQYRHGDVFIQRVDSAPRGLKPIARDNGRVILAYGEVTGHAHAIVEKGVELLSETGTENPEEMFLEVPTSATLTHEEHKKIDLPRGTYRVRRQREYAPDEIRMVAD